MDPERLKVVVKYYRDELFRTGHKPLQDGFVPLNYALWALEEVERMTELGAGNTTRCNRLLGIAQGLLCGSGLYSLQEIRNDFGL